MLKNSNLVVNEQIRSEKVQLILADGNNMGVVSRSEALDIAKNSGLDLVVIADRGQDGFPVAKIMDRGKALYEKKKKLMEAKKRQKVIQIKEIKMRPKIGDHDYETKLKQIIKFLQSGKRVKITLSFRGRENVSKHERGNEMFEKLHESLTNANLGGSLSHEKDTKMGRFWSRIYFLTPSKSK